MRLSLRTGNSAAGANLNTDSVTRGSATEIASNFVLSPRRRNVHRVRRSFVLRLLRCSDGQQSSAWHVHVTANILVHQFLSTAAFRFQAIQFECLRCFQLKDGFLFQPEATVHGLLWKRRSGTTSDAARDSTIVFGSVMCCHSLCCSFILVRDVFPSGMESLRGKPRARDSLVVWCRPSRRNLGNTSAVARGKFRTSRSDGSSQRHLDQAIVRRVYRASPGKMVKTATWPINL